MTSVSRRYACEHGNVIARRRCVRGVLSMVDFVGSASEGYPTSPSIKVHQMSIANKINFWISSSWILMTLNK